MGKCQDIPQHSMPIVIDDISLGTHWDQFHKRSFTYQYIFYVCGNWITGMGSTETYEKPTNLVHVLPWLDFSLGPKCLSLSHRDTSTRYC